MGPIRRRASRRIVKSTYDECYEYDIPGFRASESRKSTVSGARGRPSIASINQKLKSESKTVNVSANEVADPSPKKSKNVSEKGKPQSVTQKIKQDSICGKSSINEEEIEVLVNRTRMKSESVGSDNTSRLKDHEILSGKSKKERSLEYSNSKSTPNFESNDWQPVVHLEKLSYKGSGEYDSSGKKSRSTESRDVKLQTASNLAIRLKNALKDPFAERESKELLFPDGESSKNKLVSVVPKKDVSKSGVSKGYTKFDNPPSSDPTCEDWPETPSSTSDGLMDDVETFSSTDLVDWASPQMSQIFSWQDQFKNVANEMRSSFECLQSIITEQKFTILDLKNTVAHFTGSTYHKILDRILLDYDENNPRNPATVIVNSILEYDKIN